MPKVSDLDIEKLARAVSKFEGKKKQVSIGNIREILAILSDMSLDGPHKILGIIYENGRRRAGLNVDTDSV